MNIQNEYYYEVVMVKTPVFTIILIRLRMVRLCLVFTCVVCLLPSLNSAQSKNCNASILLLGNFADTESNREKYLEKIYHLVQQQEDQTYILFLGDIVDGNGLSSDSDKENLQGLRRLSQLDHVRLFFTPGDRDWDDSGEKGEKRIKDLEDFIKKDMDIKKSFYPSDACPGPESIDIDDCTRIIFVNSQWFIHPYKKAGITVTDCQIYSSKEHSIRLMTFWDELEDQIAEASGKNIVIAAHHPIYSNGRTGGKKLGMYHFLPLIGTFYVSYRKNIGTTRDLSYPAYRQFADNMREVLMENKQIVYVSGHESNADIQYIGGNYFLNSGGLTKRSPLAHGEHSLFTLDAKGLAMLNFTEEGNVNATWLKSRTDTLEEIDQSALFDSACAIDMENENIPINERYNPCAKEELTQYNWEKISEDSVVSIAPDVGLRAGSFKSWVMGNHFREQWTSNAKIPLLDLSTMHGGLIPIGKGGSSQTPSLRFLGGDGYEYYFRSIRKNPQMGMDFIQANSIYRYISTDLISTSHPYMGVVISDLMDHTDIIHEKVEIYVLPDDPALSMYRKEFGNRVGYLQERVTDSDITGKIFGDFDDIQSTTKMFRRLFKNNKNRLNQQAYARARMLDMWLGDWDRHEDNWKWAVINKEDASLYLPIPKDRDHAMSKYEGIIPNMVDLVFPNQEEFKEEFGNLRHLNFNSRFMDRFLANQLDREDWISAAAYIDSVMNEEVIENSFERVPNHQFDSSLRDIKEKLLVRKSKLKKTAEDYYKILANEVNVVGSNKREIIDVYRNPEGTVTVSVFDRKKEDIRGNVVYHRIFDPEETKEIRVYSLGGRDEINIVGRTTRSIKLRIIAGTGADTIRDNSLVYGNMKYTLVYDKNEEDHVETSEETTIIRSYTQPEYDPLNFAYDAIFPFLGLRWSSGNKFGLETWIDFTKNGFNKPGFSKIFGIKYIYFPSLNSHRLDLKLKERHLVSGWDGEIRFRIANLYDKFPYFYGIGANTIRNKEFHEDNYYRTRFTTARLSAGLVREFLYKSDIRLSFLYEFNRVNPYHDQFSIFNQLVYQNVVGLGIEHVAGVEMDFNLRFTDRKILPQNGSEIHLNMLIWNRLSAENVFASKLSGELIHHQNFHLILPTTLTLKAGGEVTSGSPAFYQLAALGSNTYMEGSFRNRYLGDKLIFANADVRVELGTWFSPILPFYYGIIGFTNRAKLWAEEEEDNPWISSFGGGLYLAPVVGDLVIHLTFAKSPDREFYYKLSASLDL